WEPFFHWYFNLPAPRAVTLNCAVAPALTLTGFGCLRMVGLASGDVRIVPFTPTVTKRLLPYATPRSSCVVPEFACAQFWPSGERRIVPCTPTPTNTALPQARRSNHRLLWSRLLLPFQLEALVEVNTVRTPPVTQ